MGMVPSAPSAPSRQHTPGLPPPMSLHVQARRGKPRPPGPPKPPQSAGFPEVTPGPLLFIKTPSPGAHTSPAEEQGRVGTASVHQVPASPPASSGRLYGRSASLGLCFLVWG